MGGRSSRASAVEPREKGSCCWGGLRLRRSKAGGPSPAPPSAPASSRAGPSDRADTGRSILRAVLGIERKCLGKEASEEDRRDDFSVECMLDEPDKRYWLCSDVNSPMVIAYFWLHFPDLYLEDLRLSLVDCKERQRRDSDSEYQELRGAEEGDPTHQEVVAYLLRVPWPFSDREILQRRWQLPLGGPGEGLAIVMRSFDDDDLYPRRPDRVRATLVQAAYLLRPLGATGADAAGGATAGGPLEACQQAEDSPGLELVVCQQIDIGGLCPPWAQRFVTRFAIQSAVEWSKKLREHCKALHARKLGQLPAEAFQGNSRTDFSLAASRKEPSPSNKGPPKPRMMSGEMVLEAILDIERRCCSCPEEGFNMSPPVTPQLSQKQRWEEEDAEGTDAEEGGFIVECLLDEPTAKYCLCGGVDSPVVIGYIRVLLADVYPGDVWRALVATEERLLRDPTSEYKVLNKAKDGDSTCQEDISFVWRAPWPFWDRDVLQRRWTFPLHDGEGLAIVMRSIEDEQLLPLREDRVRAFVHKCGYLLRPLERSRREQLAQDNSSWNCGAGLELTVCQQVDLGGLCPDWAQEVLTRWAVNRGLQWAEELREHCLRWHYLRSERAGEAAEPAPEPMPEGR